MARREIWEFEDVSNFYILPAQWRRWSDGMINLTIFRVAGLLAIIGWFISLLIPAAGWRVGESPVLGAQILLFGWLGVFQMQFAWFANLIIIPSVLLIIYPSPKVMKFTHTIFSVILLICLLQSLLWDGIPSDVANGPVVFASGYYIWNTVVGFLALCLSIQLIDKIRYSDLSSE